MSLRSLACLLLALAAGLAQAQSWPSRPIKMVVPFPVMATSSTHSVGP